VLAQVRLEVQLKEEGQCPGELLQELEELRVRRRLSLCRRRRWEAVDEELDKSAALVEAAFPTKRSMPTCEILHSNSIPIVNGIHHFSGFLNILLEGVLTLAIKINEKNPRYR
jgi:hypothetical protein